MKELLPSEVPDQLRHSLDAVVEELLGQFPPPFDPHRFAKDSPNFSALMPKGLAVPEIEAVPGYAPEIHYQLPEQVAANPVADTRISRDRSRHVVSEEMLNTLIERGKSEGFTDKEKTEPGVEKFYQGKPRSGLERLDEDYYYILTYWLNLMGFKVDIRNGANLIFDEAVLTGFFWYPPNGYMSWHTNENRPGYRFYCVYAREDAKSFFRYLCPIEKKIITSWDKIGWNFRIFKVGVEDARLWHCIYSDTDRLSFGFTVHE